MQTLFSLTALLALCLAGAGTAHAAEADYPIRPVPFTDVHVGDDFWAPRFETNRAVTVKYCFDKCEETGRIRNFAVAGGLEEGKFEGIRFNDSDVFKVVEGAAYTLAIQPDLKLDAYLDGLIAKFAAAQEDDGYLYTTRTIDPDNPAGGAGDTRWSNLRVSHELYNIGHMYEAAVAHYRATGKRNFLDVAIKSADLVDKVFGPDGIHDVPGHEEIEIGLVSLYRVTGEKRYLDLAKFFIDQRGNPAGRKELYGDYCQDGTPVVDEKVAVGHAVRAGYLYSGMADVAALTGDQAYIDALGRIWNDVVAHKLALTGGIGARRHGEAFGDPYELPNAEAYNETCAAIANAMWNLRMFLLHGEAKYIDVLERIVYNGFLSGVSLSGDRFFYPNPLAADGATPFNQGSPERQEWFGCSCCPVNIVRFIPSLAGYVYASRTQEDAAEEVFVNLFVGGEGQVTVGGSEVKLAQETKYPWDGSVRLTLTPEQATTFALKVRIPGWAQGVPVPVSSPQDGPLYSYLDAAPGDVTLKVNGKAVEVKLEDGYARIERAWKPGDTVELVLPMSVRRVLSHEKVDACVGRAALERGPIVYCVEAVDNDGDVARLVLPDDAPVTAQHRDDLLGGVTVLKTKGQALRRKEDKSVGTVEAAITAVPYCIWNHRGLGSMAVWLPRTADLATPEPIPTIASRSTLSASHTHSGDTLTALNDQLEPFNSNDHSIPRHTWWDHKGTTEWVQYDLAETTRVTGVEIYWFDDTGHGACRAPKSWRLLARTGDTWAEVKDVDAYPVARDKYNTVRFPATEVDALRIEARLQSDFSGGILEWRVLDQ